MGRYTINPHLPDPNFRERFICELKLQYEIAGGDHIFRYSYELYRIIPGAAPDKVSGRDWTPFLKRDIRRRGREAISYKAFIDIDIKYDNVLVYIETVDNNEFRNLYWSQSKRAIVTKLDRKHIYGLLEYDYGTDDWRTATPQNDLLRKIRFRARYNRDNTLSPHTKHGFALNVLLNGSEEEIDPDIKNPSS